MAIHNIKLEHITFQSIYIIGGVHGNSVFYSGSGGVAVSIWWGVLKLGYGFALNIKGL